MSETLSLHAVHHLYDKRLAQSTKPFRARGATVPRCKYCMVNSHLCICAHRPVVESNAAFMLVMYDDEVLKPSNSGRLIADVFDECFAFIWSRTNPDPDMLAVLGDERYQPYVIFPEEYAPERVATEITLESGKKPLFILLDGSWNEAKKMFRKSPYLNQFPLLSIQPEQASRFTLRESAKDNQLATAEVAARIVDLFGESANAQTLDLWFDVFREHYLTGKKQRTLPIPGALDRLAAHLNATETQ
uniref:tRNA-uridine aminocarboxypropyltransferase n=1 Tax=Thaumasiovibrio occultus TaxID=1891184 RepID=UPI000B35CB44|nr:tRNA-uridine aminocarboxypropyltransferase [Thaumasiovibrio occultus]